MNPVIDDFGNKRWYNEQGQLHREDGPAVEYTDGSKSWYQNGLFHRIDGPAIEWSDREEYWIKGKRLTREEFNRRLSLPKAKKAKVVFTAQFETEIDISEAEDEDETLELVMDEINIPETEFVSYKECTLELNSVKVDDRELL